MTRIRTKRCDCCQQLSDVLYRVRVVSGASPVEKQDGNWQFVCNHCWQTIDSDSPDYSYGGTWKAHKR
ncbi:hypothetical protein [Chamaesiphon minutus]|uniref:Uncharacterized protein n=1 Tax=Chamaesiphon minutus (strain ATCC 27169 / PCC 6605) TaxID=1173020 RepID=K9UMH3_CHAP6|nr:hypothetical protein [Chamaesiphon minutus]AFY95848.1 hypothetical protein Cha6605_4939 [Chamaesiphon minutus PCC 6605]